MRPILKILLGIGIILIILLCSQIVGKSTYSSIQEAKERADLEVCNKIPFFRYHMEMVPDILGTHPEMYNARKYCKREALVIYPKSSGFYRFSSEEEMKKFYYAVKNKNPGSCLLLDNPNICFGALMEKGVSETCTYYSEYNTGLGYSLPEGTNPTKYYYQFCVKELRENLDDPLSCDFLSSADQEFSLLIDCKSQFVAFGKLNATFCEEFSGQAVTGKYKELGFKDGESYCYYAITQTYNHFLSRSPRYQDQRLFWYVKEDNGVGRFAVYYPKPKIKYVCDELNDKFTTIQGVSLNYKDMCERYFKTFNEFSAEVDLMTN